jgi:hypothetical protein
MQRLLPLGVVFSFLLVAADARAQTGPFNVTVVSGPAYQINGATQPTITLTRGQTYTFNLDSSVDNFHPFHIKTAAVSGTPGAVNDYNVGVTNNGNGATPLTFAVQASAPPSLVYECGIHSFMVGTIQIVDPPPVAPAGGTYAMAALVLALGVAGVVTRRRVAR